MPKYPSSSYIPPPIPSATLAVVVAFVDASSSRLSYAIPEDDDDDASRTHPDEGDTDEERRVVVVVRDDAPPTPPSHPR